MRKVKTNKTVTKRFFFASAMNRIEIESTYKRKSCSQCGLFPLTVTVVDFTFCSFNTTYELNSVAGISKYCCNLADIIGFQIQVWDKAMRFD